MVSPMHWPSTALSAVENDEFLSLERRVAKLAGRKHCVMSGRGSSALLLALQALDVPSGKVILPDICCPHPAWVPGYLGLDTLFCDVELDTFAMCPDALETLLDTHDDVVAVIVVHLYGSIAPIAAIGALLARRGIALIEDGAQAVGGRLAESPVGSHGELAIFSFGATKNVDAGWGGVTLTDDDELHVRLCRARAELPERPCGMERIEQEYRDVYYRLVALRDINPAFNECFKLLPDAYRSMLLFGPRDGQPARLSAELDSMDVSIAHRREIAALYREGLRHRLIRHGTFDEGAVPWRYSVLIGDGHRNGVTDAVREAGLHASNWYPALHRWFPLIASNAPPGNTRSFPNAERIESEVLNLWVSPQTTRDVAKHAIEVVLNYLEQCSPGVKHV